MTGFKLIKLHVIGTALVAGSALFNPAHAERVYKLTDEGLITYQDRAPDSDQNDGHKAVSYTHLTLPTKA